MDVRIVSGYLPGAIGRITELHGTYYSRHWGFGLYFERWVARGMADFLGRFDARHDGLWIAVDGERIVGGIAADGGETPAEGAHLHWFIVDDACRGRGVGRRLFETAEAFCRPRFHRAFLWTFAGLDPARRLYESYGFRLAREQDGDQWGITVREQLFERTYGNPPPA